MTKKNSVALACILLAGCASQKELVPTGGSKADGVVRESFEYGGFEKPVIDWNQAGQSAADRCAAWGYAGAQRFGGQLSQCEVGNMYGCQRWLITIQYQCMGGATGGAGK